MDLPRTDDGMTLVSRFDFQRDPFSPVSRLPVEILANIFIYTAHNSYKTSASHPKPATPSWVDVSYVCRRWRDIALNCQILWTYIPRTISQRWMQELLARSQKAPLKIRIEPNSHFDCVHVLSTVEQLMNHSQRIQELHLDFFHVTPEHSYQALFKIFASHLPCLHHLEISKLDFRRPEGESSSPFEGNTPALRTLMIRTCCIPWTSLELSALTSLHLRSAELPFPEITTMSEFLAVLRRTPYLVQLSVSTFLSSHQILCIREFNAAPIINLSHLSNMSIEAPILMINTLLSCVDIPLTTKVELECEISYESTAWQDDIIRLASLLAQRINPSSHPTPAAAPSFRSLTINNTLDTATLAFSMSERVSSSMMSSHQLDENTRLLVYIDILVDRASSGSSAISSLMCRSMMPLTSIRSVHFVGSTTPLLNFWRDMLASFPNVRHIKLSNNYMMPQIASMLSLPSHDCSGDMDGPVDGGRNEIFVPALEELELYRITFSTVGSDLNSLCEAISTRKGTQCKLAIKKSRMITGGAYEALELVGCWEDNQFKVTRL